MNFFRLDVRKISNTDLFLRSTFEKNFRTMFSKVEFPLNTYDFLYSEKGLLTTKDLLEEDCWNISRVREIIFPLKFQNIDDLIFISWLESRFDKVFYLFIQGLILVHNIFSLNYGFFFKKPFFTIDSIVDEIFSIKTLLTEWTRIRWRKPGSQTFLVECMSALNNGQFLTNFQFSLTDYALLIDEFSFCRSSQNGNLNLQVSSFLQVHYNLEDFLSLECALSFFLNHSFFSQNIRK